MGERATTAAFVLGAFGVGKGGGGKMKEYWRGGGGGGSGGGGGGGGGGLCFVATAAAAAAVASVTGATAAVHVYLYISVQHSFVTFRQGIVQRMVFVVPAPIPRGRHRAIVRVLAHDPHFVVSKRGPHL